MCKRYIAVLDSGLGGISVLKSLKKEYPFENYIYFGDNENAPYGNKTVDELFEITKRNVDVLKKYPLKAIVLGCNTLSVNLKDEIEKYARVLVVGVYPPVDKIDLKNNRTLLLSTKRTAERYRKIKYLDVLGLENLAIEIENNPFRLDNIDLEKNLRQSVGEFIDKKGVYDVVILGCTHYEFIKNKILDHFCPKKILCSSDFVAQELSLYLSKSKSQVKHNQNETLFIGKNAYIYNMFDVKSG